MSLTALPVTSSDLTTLQQGLTFTTNATDAANQANAINAPGSSVSVFTYAASLINANLSLSQVAMGLFPFMAGVTDTTAHIGVITTQFLPAQVAFAVSKGFNPTVFAAEAYGSALSTNAAFNTNFVTPFANNPAGFAANVSAATGVSAGAILQFVNNWTLFFTQHPEALQGRTVTQASFGSAFGDAFGTALVTPGLTSNIATVFSTNPNFPFSPNTVQGIVANALIDNAEGLYNAGVALGTLPPHQLLQGEAGAGPGQLTLTTNVDSGPNFTTNIKGATFTAPPGSNILGPSNTLNTGDNFGSTVGDATLNLTQIASLTGNPPRAIGVTMFGVETANITNISGVTGGFSGNITGLKTVDFKSGSNAQVILGEVAGPGLNTALQTVKVNANQNFIAWIAAAALAGTSDAVTVNVTGSYGAAGNAKNIVLGNDTGVKGTPAAPMNAYETENISATGPTFVELSNAATGTLSTTTFVLTGAGALELSANAAGDFAKVTSIDASGTSGGVAITGALNIGATNVGTPLVPVNDDVDAGLLNGNTAITSFKGGSGKDFIDLTSLSLAQVNAMTTLDGGGDRDTVIYKAAVLNTGALLKSTGFEIVGSGPGLTGIVNWANLGVGVDTVKLFDDAGAGALTFNNVPTGATLDLGRFSDGITALTVNGPVAGTTDVFNLIQGGHAGTDLGSLTINAFEVVNHTIEANVSAINITGNVAMTPSLGGSVNWNINDTLSPGGDDLIVGGTTNVGAGGGIHISGAGLGDIQFTGPVTAAILEATGFAGSLTMGNDSVNTAVGGATSAITILGTPIGDDLIGSNAKDVINSGAGNDIVANHVNLGNPATQTTENDQIFLGSGADLVNLFGDTAGAGGTLLTTARGQVPLVADFLVSAPDVLGLSENGVNYNGINAGNIYPGIAVAAPGATTVQNVVPGVSVGVLATTDILHLGSFNEAAGMTIGQAFDAALGGATVTGFNAVIGASIFFSMFDLTTGQMLIGDADSSFGGAASFLNDLDAGSVHLIGVMTMSAADYIAFDNTNLRIVT
jgi:hypothetical protein